MQSAKIASININGLSTRTRVGMLLDFIRRYDLDFVFLQEVTDPAILNTTGYATYLSIGAGRPYWQNTIFPSLTSLPYRRDLLSPRITTAFVLLMCTHPQARPEERTGNVSLLPSCLLYSMPPFNLYS